MNKRERVAIQQKLEKDLQQLKETYRTGFQLDLLYSPGEIIKDGAVIAGEVLNGYICIYSHPYKRAKQTLCHEFVEHLLMDLVNDCWSMISLQNDLLLDGLDERSKMILLKHNLIHKQMIVKRKEELVNRLILPHMEK